jgi:serine/threonine protein kinase
MALTAGMRLGPYEISAWLGAGGMGHVYRARDTPLGRPVAIKILESSASGDNALRVRPLDSLVARRLTEGASQPFWSFDSRSIAFAAVYGPCEIAPIAKPGSVRRGA